MPPLVTALRRTMLLVLLAAGLGAALSSWRSRSTALTPAEPPQWPEWPQQPHQEPDADASERPSDRPGTPPSAPAWSPARPDGTAPESHPIKVKMSSGIYHLPGGRFYQRTRADRCYPTAAAAEADGYRPSKT